MTNNDNQPTNDIKTEDAAAEQAPALSVSNELNERQDLKSDSRPKENMRSGLVELPESVRQKLEKQKEARTKKLKKKKTKKAKDKRISTGRAYVKSTYNNTIITLTDATGNVLSWASAGIAGFKGPKKSTPYAAQVITRIAVERAREQYGLEEVSVFVNGVGTGREAAVRALNANGLLIVAIKDITPVPHNGCRPKKPRRV